ncbi:hypothetical protein [uncultured Winogradskyella sp.]|uniref:hypothetical protein n=1 Tax=uncultured Winogradskyella sp. TaxID=395353 RepID=UPI00260EF305|nr:hypothetical protein [uncultured Winogradskyella sp.]
MKFDLNKSIELLEKTPVILESFLENLSNDWLKSNEGEKLGVHMIFLDILYLVKKPIG